MEYPDVPTVADSPRTGAPIIARAVQGSRLEGLALTSGWGEGVAVSNGIPGIRILELPFTTTSGNFEVWVEFAAVDSRPVTLSIDGVAIMSNAVGQTTSGWMPQHQTWHRQVSLPLDAGRHTVGLRHEAHFPHVRRIALVPVANAVASEQPGIALERRIGARANVLELAEFEDLADATLPVLRNLLGRRRSAESILAAVAELASAVWQDLAAPQERTGVSASFNGQLRRRMLFNRLDAVLGFDVFVETGTHRGTTTEMLAGLGRPVFACELNRQFYLRARVRLCGNPAVKLYNLDSRRFLKQIFALDLGWKMPFFYLDAHWGKDLPLPDEILLIATQFPDFVVFVDDFQHPDPGYGFDRYDSGVELTLSYLLPRLVTPAALEFLVPSAPANTETGGRRGTLVIVPAHMYRDLLAAEPLLMRVPSDR